jgi:lipopolysaccharide biosynthesis regulator YciM
MTALYWLLAAVVLVIAVFVLWRLGRRDHEVASEVLLSRTFSRILEGDRQEVLEQMRKLYSQTDQDLGVGLALGSLLRHVGKIQPAIRTHRSLSTRAHLDAAVAAQIHIELCADYLESGLLDRARRSLDDAMAQGETNEAIARYGEQVLVRLGEWDAAFRLIQNYGKKHDVDVKERLALLRYRQGEAYRAESLRDESLAAYKKALAADEGCLPAYLAVSRHHREKGNARGARNILYKNRARFHGQEWLFMRELMHNAKTFDQHQDFLSEANQRLEEDGGDWRSRHVLGGFLMEIGEYEQAAEVLLDALRRAPKVLPLHQTMWSLMARHESRELFNRYRDLARADLTFSNPYECNACRFTTAELSWFCPSCNRLYSFSERHL